MARDKADEVFDIERGVKTKAAIDSKEIRAGRERIIERNND
jgi:hypothetical protein